MFPAMRSPYVFFHLPHLVAAGSWHMAADRQLLQWVSQSSSRLVFRTYAWDRPTLSLGRSEPYPEGWDESALARAGIAVVRRPTGGNAVLHVEEVTFALAASIPGPWELTPRGFANAAAEALSEALAACGVPGSLARDVPPSAGPVRRPAAGALCFARTAPGEVEAAGYKVAGIASRFGRKGALCHASVPLTARSREVAAFRSEIRAEAEALDRHARSVGELLGLGPGPAGADRALALGAVLAAALAGALASRFGARQADASFAVLGIEEGSPTAAATPALA